jgi:hypothetical protein
MAFAVKTHARHLEDKPVVQKKASTSRSRKVGMR